MLTQHLRFFFKSPCTLLRLDTGVISKKIIEEIGLYHCCCIYCQCKHIELKMKLTLLHGISTILAYKAQNRILDTMSFPVFPKSSKTRKPSLFGTHPSQRAENIYELILKLNSETCYQQSKLMIISSYY